MGAGRGQWGEVITGATIKDTGQNQGGGWRQGREIVLVGVGALMDGETRQSTVIE